MTEADIAKYHVVLFGDPGSNKWIAKLNGKLPVKWSKDTVAIGTQSFPAAESFPASTCARSAPNGPVLH